MANDQIKCPQCGHEIPITQVLKHRLNEQINVEVAKKVAAEKINLETEIRQKFQEENTNSLKQLQEKLTFEAKKRQEAEKKELDLIKKQTELEDKIRHQDLEIARRLQEERKLIIDKAQKETEEKMSLQNQELRKQLDDTKKALIEAQRKAQQGSMQTQGEVMELALEEMLKQNFPHDVITGVPKGATGADIIQKVFAQHGQECGSIVWESKQTKAWTEDWVQKLKDDGRNIRANILVLVSEILPKNIKNLGFYKGVWVCNFSSILGLTMALRSQLISTAKVISSQEGKEEKKDILYDYLCSPTFANRVESMVENFLSIKNTLEKEKMAMNKIWAARETQVNRMIENTVKMYGEIQGIAGSQLPAIELLQLEAAAPEIIPEVESSKKSKKESPDNQTGLF